MSPATRCNAASRYEESPQMCRRQDFMTKKWSGKRDSNSRPPPWQGGALPLSYFRKWSGKRGSNSRPPPWQGGALPLSYFRISSFVLISFRRPCVSLTDKNYFTHSSPVCQHLFGKKIKKYRLSVRRYPVFMVLAVSCDGRCGCWALDGRAASRNGWRSRAAAARKGSRATRRRLHPSAASSST